MATVADEINAWLQSITQTFKGGYSGSGENGVDIGLPYHTPIYAVAGGKVVGAGSYAGGGVVSIEATPGASLYYQHLSDWVVKVGQVIQPGQLIGYSGGQIGYGDHPSSPQYSSGPHIEFGINGPFGANSLWHPEGANVDPLSFLHSLVSGATGGASTSTGTSTLASTSTLGLPDPTGISNELQKFNNGIVDWLKRGALIGLGGALLLLGVTVLLFDKDRVEAAAGTAAKVGAAAA